ncbi:hypothetical protein SAMN02910357_01726 [Succinivibrio dextrinosolvens]|uniref:hypothetical protein n=1 Tax=Succinivibrio dextrinosolvens TaxID=83771 RepID=UPI0008EF418E|nr:hypothetical protein [Succinivibrio dextrinosolvens]SFS76817.1 hypothetical protein SAMN02910357_01726 [Succinivibrio dextrinosolvens]
MDDFDNYLAEQLKNPKFKKEYESIDPDYQMKVRQDTVVTQNKQSEKKISFEESVDPFYSKENMERLRKSIAQMEATGGTIHEVDKV